MRKEEYPNVALLIDSNMFMDDFVAGVENGNGAISIYYELSALMKTIKPPMAKWATSCEELKEIWKAEGQEIQRTTQDLGVDWNTESDSQWIPGTSRIKQHQGLQLIGNCSKGLLGFTTPWTYFHIFPLSGRYSSKKPGAGECSGRRFCPMTLELVGTLG